MRTNHTNILRTIVGKAVLTIALLITFFAPLVGMVPSVRAQAVLNSQGATAQNGYGTATGGTTGATPFNAAASNQNDPGGTTKWECDKQTSIFLGCIIYAFTVGLMSAVAYIGGFVFDVGVHLSLQSTAYSLDFLTMGWAAVRDIANMAFIFILVYIALTIILEAEGVNTMKMLAGVVVMALLINFSFLLTRVVIDAGNILAIQFYNSINAPTIGDSAQKAGINPGAGVTNAIGLNSNSKDLTASMMQVVQVQNILGTQSFQTFIKNNNDASTFAFITNLISQAVVFIGVGVIFAFLAFAFFTVGVKFILRIIILWFVIIAAPLAFTAKALTGKGSITGLFDEWLNTLIKFSFYPAIFLFIFLIINYISNALGANNGLVPAIFSDINAGTNATTPILYIIGAAIANVAIRMGIVVAMLYYGTQVTDKLVTHGAGVAGNVTAWASGKANTFARRAPVVAAAPPTRGVLGLTGAAATGATRKLGLEKTWVGYQAHRLSEKLDTVKVNGKSRADIRTANKEHKEHAEHEKHAYYSKINNKEDFATLVAMIKKEKAGTALNPNEENKRGEIITRMRGYSQEEVDALKKEDLVTAAAYVPAPIYKKIEASKKHSDHDKDEILGARNKAIAEPFTKKLPEKMAVLTAQKADAETAKATHTAALAAHGAANPITVAAKADLDTKEAERDTTAAEVKKLADQMNRLGKDELAALSKNDIEKVMTHVTEPMMKRIEESDRNITEKEALRAQWEEQSTHAPLAAANKQIDLLRKIVDELDGTRFALGDTDSVIGGASTRHQLTNQSFGADSVEKMEKEFRQRKGQLETAIRDKSREAQTGARDAELISLRQTHHQIDAGLKKIEKLDEERKKVGPEVGGERAPGKFKTRDLMA